MKKNANMNTKHTQNQPSLKEVFKDDFYLGAALNLDQISGREPKTTAIVEKHFNSITPENILKWEEVHPGPDKYQFEPVDNFVALGEKNNMHIIGHTLVWFHQTPDWVFHDKSGKLLNRDALLSRMKEHIFTVMGRYKGKIHGWDVVNEAILPEGHFRKCKWLDIIGEDYVLKAFEYAREADPDAELYYNDYNFYRGRQCETIIHLIQNLQSKGIQIDGVGIQGHWGLDYPEYGKIESIFRDLSVLGVKLMITELDVTALPFAEDYMDMKLDSLSPELQKKLNPYTGALPESVQNEQARRYADYFAIFLKYREIIKRVTFWGIHDKQSWRSYWPVVGRTDHPLLFDHRCEPKPALDAIIETGLKRR